MYQESSSENIHFLSCRNAEPCRQGRARSTHLSIRRERLPLPLLLLFSFFSLFFLPPVLSFPLFPLSLPSFLTFIIIHISSITLSCKKDGILTKYPVHIVTWFKFEKMTFKLKLDSVGTSTNIRIINVVPEVCCMLLLMPVLSIAITDASRITSLFWNMCVCR